MIYLISYDITEDKLRRKVSNYLFYAGLERIQLSVFLGFITSQYRQTVMKKLADFYQLSTHSSDKIIILPIHQLSVQSANFMGTYDPDLLLEINRSLKVKIY